MDTNQEYYQAPYYAQVNDNQENDTFGSSYQSYYQAPYPTQVNNTQENDTFSPSSNQVAGNNYPSSYAAIGQPDSYSGYGAQEKATQISQIEIELRNGRFVWYRRLVALLIFCFFALFIFSIVGIFALPNALIYWGFVVVCIWNMRHLIFEYRTLQNLDYHKSEKAAKSMRVYNFAGPILIVLAQFLCQQNVLLIILTLILHAGGFYLVISFGAQKVSDKLRARDALQRALELSLGS